MAEPGFTRRGILASSAILAAGAAVASAASAAPSITQLVEQCRQRTAALEASDERNQPEQCRLIDLETEAFERLAYAPARNVADVRDKFRVLFGEHNQAFWSAELDLWQPILADLERLA